MKNALLISALGLVSLNAHAQVMAFSCFNPGIAISGEILETADTGKFAVRNIEVRRGETTRAIGGGTAVVTTSTRSVTFREPGRKAVTLKIYDNHDNAYNRASARLSDGTRFDCAGASDQ